MNLYIRLRINFWTHRKTTKLRTLLGDDALWIMPRLWSYAAENQPDGNFSKYSPEEIALLIGYNGNAQELLQALLEASFMDQNHVLHGWDEHNGYHVSFAERARHAATVRWEKQQKKGKSLKEDKDIDKETSIALSMPQALLEHESTFKSQLGSLFHRRPTTPWDKREAKVLREILERPECVSELAEICNYYQAKSKTPDGKFLRQELQTLLNNWPGELDRARAYKPQRQTVNLI